MLLAENKKITYLGKNFESFKSFCDYFELNRSTANSRFRRNWELSDIIQKPTAKNREISYSGKDYPSISALSKDLGLDYKLVYKRIHSFEWPVKDAVETPKKLGRSVSVHGKNFQTLKAAAKHFGIPAGLLQWRIATGWPLEKAVDPEAEVNNRKPIEIEFPDIIKNVFSIEPIKTFRSRDYLLVYRNELEIKNITLNHGLLNKIDLGTGGIIVTSKGDKSDFVSRYFTPNSTITEDPVTGSAHCSLIPYWGEVLNKKKMTAIQLSERRGELICEDKNKRVLIGGKAKIYSKGSMWI